MLPQIPRQLRLDASFLDMGGLACFAFGFVALLQRLRRGWQLYAGQMRPLLLAREGARDTPLSSRCEITAAQGCKTRPLAQYYRSYAELFVGVF